MSNRIAAVFALALGVLLVIVSAAADGLGVGAAPGFGWKQMVGMAAGVVLAGFGIARLRR